MENENLKYFIIKKNKFLGSVRYDIHDRTFYDLNTATRKLLALDELNNEKEDTSYHLQVVDTYLDNSKDTVVMANGSHNMDTI